MIKKISSISLAVLLIGIISSPLSVVAEVSTDSSSTEFSTTSLPDESTTGQSTVESTSESTTEKTNTTSSDANSTTSESSTSISENTEEKLNTSKENAVDVSNWSEFVSAYNNKEVTQIKVTQDIKNDNIAKIKERETSIDIDGGNHIFDMQNESLRIKAFDTGPQTFSVHDVSKVLSTEGTVWGFISNYRDWAMGDSGWTINVSNITSDASMRTRLVTSLGSQLNLSGNVTWYTASEMAQVSGVRIEENANVFSKKVNTPDDRSFFWFADTTGKGIGSREFVVGKNAKASFKMDTGGTTYPVVFAYYDRIHLEEGATFNATMQGNAFRSDWGKGSDFIADGNNKINFTSLSKGSAPIYFNGTDKNKQNIFSVGPNSELYVISATNTPLFTTGNNDNKNRSVLINSPKILDLKNYSNGTNAGKSSITNGKIGSFKIVNSDISLWNLATDVNSNSDFRSTKVGFVEQTPNGISSDDKQLEKVFNTNKQRRISALNQNPTTEWTNLTDADKSIKTRVKIGEFPDNKGMDDHGNIHYIPIYASKGEASVTVRDTYGKEHTDIPTDENGYAIYLASDFQEAGKEVYSSAVRGPWKQESPVSTSIIDVTPPEPAIVKEQLNPKSKLITGTGEPGSDITITINGEQEPDVKGTISGDGQFLLDISKINLKENDIVQIFLQDHSGKADIPDRPNTNNDIGNIEPANDLTFRDRLFKAATKLKVHGILTFDVPSIINYGGSVKLSPNMLHLKGESMGDLMVSDTRDSNQKTNWKLLLKETKALLNKNGVKMTYINRDNQLININENNQPIEHNLANHPEEDKISDNWKKPERGLFLDIPSEAQKIGEYSGSLTWTLQDTPQAN
ncbi:hypothetical protein IBQ15_002650 [Enterococcus faecalis]|nr:hypothetical protein [Enterococcus faecalis]